MENPSPFAASSSAVLDPSRPVRLSAVPVEPLVRTGGAKASRWILFPAVLCVLLLSVKLHQYWQERFIFDDAYMYCRYAFNFRHGGGIAWNPGGPHTFGLTSLPWFFIILAGTYLIKNPATLLTAASCTTGLLALGLLSFTASRFAKSPQLRAPANIFCCMASVLLLNWRFSENWANGMETMLGMLSIVLFLGAHERFQGRTTWKSLLVLSLCSVFCVLTRPELLIVVVALPPLACFLNTTVDRWRWMGWYGGLLGGLVVSALCLNKAYFGTPVPLAFYLKAMHGYEGYRLYINPWTYTAIFFSISLPFLLILVGLARRSHAKLIAVFLLPAGLSILYLATVTQIMGGEARYYLPLLPLIVFPSLLVLDDYLLRNNGLRPTGKRLAALIVCFLLSRDYTQMPTWFMGKFLVKRQVFYSAPVFLPTPSPALPDGFYWKQSAVFASQLPPNTTFAASEVGILGASAPQVHILDLAGLNDAHLALHPSDSEYVLSQQPDIIWLPHPDYTKFYGELASAPELLGKYDVYTGALGFGLAVRKASRSRPDFEAAVEHGWEMLYPGYPMRNYAAQKIEWDHQLRLHGTGTNLIE